MNNITIKNKLYGLAGLITVCLMILSVTALNSFSKTKILNETLVLIQKSKSDILMLRRNEKDFLARLNLKYQKKFKQNFDYLIDDIEQVKKNSHMLGLNYENKLAKLSQYINAYNASFKSIVSINQTIGLDHNSGLRGKLRTAVHDVEDTLKALGETQLTADILMLRRNEKDFMLRKLEKYISKFNNNYTVFFQHLRASGFDNTTKNVLHEKMALYQSDFLKLTEEYKRLGLTPKVGLHGKMRNSVHKTEALFNSVETELATSITAQNKALYEKFLILTAIFIILIIGAVIMISRSIISRLGNIQSHLNQVVLNSGDLSASINIGGKDEVASIAELFNQFVTSLKGTFNQIPLLSENLKQSSEINTSVSAQTYQKALAQQERSSEIQEAVQQMVLATQDITQDIHTAASSAEKAKETVLKGKKEIEAVGLSINSLAKKLHSSAEITKDLEENSQNISTVLDVIRGIAEQTNLLALNAAIEAARAGEQGRGFAVVADEVRTLASRTQDSTTQIQSLIESFQKNVQNTVNIMQESSSNASSTSNDALNATQVLDEISQTVNRIFELNTNIASASEKQSAISTNISRSVSEISDTAQETASQSNKVSQSSTQINAISLELQTLVSSYKLE